MTDYETLYLRDDEVDEFGDSAAYGDTLEEDYEEEEEEEEAELPAMSEAQSAMGIPAPPMPAGGGGGTPKPAAKKPAKESRSEEKESGEKAHQKEAREEGREEAGQKESSEKGKEEGGQEVRTPALSFRSVGRRTPLCTDRLALVRKQAAAACAVASVCATMRIPPPIGVLRQPPASPTDRNY